MIRLIFVAILFLIYGNFSFVINDIVVFSLINIAFYTVLKEKNIKIIDVLIFILSTFVIEVFVGLPILIGPLASEFIRDMRPSTKSST